MKREQPNQPRTLRTIVRKLLRAGTYDLGDGQRGGDVARDDSMMEPFFQMQGCPSFHTFARFSSLSILLHGIGARDGMCVHAYQGANGARE